jgi:O-antigen/teichoic acid export membrane protein
MVFTAMSTDYFPRLSGVADDIVKTKTVINQQAEVAILILAPILTVFLIFINWVVILLYSNRFLPVVSMIHWAALGIFFKAASWPIAYLIIAKGDSKVFFISELAVNIYVLGFNMLGYLLGGLEGLGISFFIGYLFYLGQVFLIVKRKYSFSFLGTFIKITGIQFLLGVACFLSGRFINAPYLYLIGSLLILAATYYSYRELDKRIGLKATLFERFRKNQEDK